MSGDVMGAKKSQVENSCEVMKMTSDSFKALTMGALICFVLFLFFVRTKSTK